MFGRESGFSGVSGYVITYKESGSDNTKTRDVPAASDMCRCEDKLPKVAAYAAKRAGKILIRKIKGN